MQAASPALTLDPDIIEAAANAAAWPFEEARKLVARLEKSGKTEVLFETGYGPRACRISAPSGRSPAPPWCATPSGCSPATRCRPG